MRGTSSAEGVGLTASAGVLTGEHPGGREPVGGWVPEGYTCQRCRLPPRHHARGRAFGEERGCIEHHGLGRPRSCGDPARLLAKSRFESGPHPGCEITLLVPVEQVGESLVGHNPRTIADVGLEQLLECRHTGA
jgi:hypothetical protein